MRIGRFLTRLMLFLCLLLIIFRICIESTQIQNWLVDKVTNYLSKELNTKVKVDHVDFALFNSMILDGLLIEDTRGDTLLYVGNLNAKIKSGFWGFINQDIQVSTLDLYNGKATMYKDTTMMNGNMGFITEYFSGGIKDSLQVESDTIIEEVKPLLLGIKNIGLHNIVFERTDMTKGEHMKVWLGEGDITGLNFDKIDNHLQLDKIILDEFHFHFFKKERQLPPPLKESIDRDSSYNYFTATVNKIKAIDGHFEFYDYSKEATRTMFENTMDFNDLSVIDIQADIDSFWLREDFWFKGRMNNMEAKEKSGFTLLPSRVEDVEVTCEGLHLYGLELNTPTTTIGDTLELNYRRYGYPSFLSFVDDVRIGAKLKEGSKISLEDIFTFAPALQSNRFFKNNSEEVLQVQGELSGSINRLKTKGFLLKIGNRLTMKGDLRSRNITQKGEESFDFELENLTTDIPSIRALVPDFNPPAQFDKLGKLQFKGRFTGFLTSFTADGYLKTALGDIRSDISLKGEKSNAKYSGNLDLINFDLGQWTDNPDLGLVSFSSQVKNGVGLDLSEINADISAQVSSFTFKDYTYKLLNVGGNFDKKKFDGDLSIKDENIEINFNGLVDFNDSIPEFDFKAIINNLKLDALNLTKKPFDLKAELDFNFKGLKLEDLEGEASARNVELLIDTITLELDSIYAFVKKDDGLNKRIGIRSEVLTGEVIGNFEIDELPKIVMSYAKRNFSKFTDKLNINPNLLGFNEPRSFDFDFFIENSKNLTQFISPKLDTIFNSDLRGYFDSRRDTLMIDFGIERIRYDNFELDDINVFGQFTKNKGNLDVIVNHTLSIKDSLSIPPIAIQNYLHNDTLDFQLDLNDFTQVLDKLNLNGSLTLDDEDIFKITFGSSDLVLLNHKWEILKDNFVKFGKGQIKTQNFKMFNLDLVEQKVELNSIDEKGLELLIKGIDIEMLNSYINYDKLLFKGPITNLRAETKDVFKLEEIVVEAEMDTLFINDENFGKLKLELFTPDTKSLAAVSVKLEKGEQKLAAQGFYYPPYMEKKPNHLQLDIDINKYPLALSEYFLGENISETSGNIDAKLSLEGPVSNLQLTGETRVYDAITTIDYLQSSIAVPQGKINILPNLIDLSGLKIYDKEGNVATVGQGKGITKDHLKNFGLDIEINSDKFIALDTNIDDNETFYGRGIGKVDARFTGDFKNTDMSLDVTTAKGTEIFMPITSSRTASELSFITFTDTTKTTNFTNQFISEELRGLDLTLNLTITPDAEIQLVIDQNAGDILKGRGNGELEINVTRDGDFKMSGLYTVEEGNYLFTLLNVVNKPFIIKKGGTIVWDGDPLGAKINLEAAYQNLTTTPYNFILEYLNNTDEKLEAQRTTPVDLSMSLKGELFKPDISFDIAFPNLRGRVKTYTDSKLRIIREDDNELNRQVLGLIAFGSFFPSDMAYSNSGLIDGGINTLSELLSNQLSIYLGELLSEVITDVDIDFNYRYYELQDVGIEDYKTTGSELEVRLKKGLFNNRLVINAGSNFDIDGGTDTGAFLAGDLLIEYLLTPDGRFKIRFYSGSDLTISGRRNQTGVGLTYRKEFDTFKDLFKKTENRTFKVEKNYEIFLDNLKKAAERSLMVE